MTYRKINPSSSSFLVPSSSTPHSTATMSSPVHISSKEQFSTLLTKSRFVVADCKLHNPTLAPLAPLASPRPSFKTTYNMLQLLTDDHSLRRLVRTMQSHRPCL